ncbi:MAG: transketolase, partial [Candidatus Moranbacteria bacterium]|nr:transketolase [Candidatus Moranbacteria bacterium]
MYTNIENISRQIRRWCVEMTTKAGSGHLTSSLSAVEAMAVLLFSEKRFFRYDISRPEAMENDRLIFSKGHASPLFYSLWAMAGGIEKEELMAFRTLESRLEGHPTRKFPFVEVPTGSLGQGLGVGVGEAIFLKKYFKEGDDAPRVFVLLGDSEIAEGSVWESAMIASHYQLDNLVAVVDVNRLGQRRETVHGWDID